MTSLVGGRRWLGVCLGLACGSPPASTVLVDNSTNVTIHADGTPADRAPAIDFDDPRVAVAQREIAKLLGHPLGFEFDAAVVASFGDGLHHAYVSALETAALSLARCQEREPEAFASGKAQLQRLHFSYDPALTEQSPDADLADSALVIAVRSDRGQLLGSSELCRALKRGREQDHSQRFSTLDPARVPAGQAGAYLDFLIQDRGGDDGLSRELQELKRGSRILEFHPHIQQPAVRAQANAWLSRFGSTLARSMAQQSNDAVLLTAIGQAHPAWIRWLNANSTQLERNDRKEVAQLLFRHPSREVPELAQGFDSYGFALPIVKQWLEELPYADPRKGEDQLYVFVVCRAERERRDEPDLFVQKYCNGVFYGDLARTPPGRQRLAAQLLQHKQELLTQTAMLHALRAAGTDSVVLLLPELASDPATMHVALRALADYTGWRRQSASPGDRDVVSDPRPLVASVPGFYESLPEQRPALLYLLTQLGEKREGSVPWPKLASFLGSRIDERALGGFLAEEHDAMKSLDKLMPALSPGWPRSRVIVPSFEAWLDADAARRSSDSQAYYVTGYLVEALCKAGVASDLAAFQQALRARGERYPSQAKRLSSYTEPTTAKLCPQLKPAKASRQKAPPELFAD